jgi:hypothetical protein
MPSWIAHLTAQADTSAGPTVVDWIGGVASLIQALAILAGGIWAYLKFVRGRLNLPRATLKHEIRSYHAEGQLLLHVNTVIANPGSIVLRIEKGIIRIQQVLPLSGAILAAVREGKDPELSQRREFPWPLVGARSSSWGPKELEIEPGETDEVAADFVLSDDVRTIEVYTYFENVQRKRKYEQDEPIGWGLTTLYEIAPEQEPMALVLGEDVGEASKSDLGGQLGIALPGWLEGRVLYQQTPKPTPSPLPKASSPPEDEPPKATERESE